MSKEPIEYLKHIAEECSYILSVTHGLTKEAFLIDETLKRAIVRSLEIIGEATKRIPSEICDFAGRGRRRGERIIGIGKRESFI